METQTEEETPTDSNDMALFTVGSASSNPISAELEIDGKSVSMEVDTGAAVSIMSGAMFAAYFPDKHLSPSTVTLKTYTGETMKVLGEVEVSMQYKQQPLQRLPLKVTGHLCPYCCSIKERWSGANMR